MRSCQARRNKENQHERIFGWLEIRYPIVTAVVSRCAYPRAVPRWTWTENSRTVESICARYGSVPEHETQDADSVGAQRDNLVALVPAVEKPNLRQIHYREAAVALCVCGIGDPS